MRSLLIAGLAVGWLGAQAQAKEHTVVQKDKAFSVKELKVKKGETVSFENKDSSPHHIMFKDGATKVNQKQASGANPIKHTFQTPGETTVRCAIHPKMKIKVTVE